MQIQPSSYRRKYSPVSLPEDFPVYGPFRYKQPDKDITWLHQHNGLELGYCYSGSGIFVIEGKVFSYSQGDISVINEREMHLAQSSPGTVSEWDFIILDPAVMLGITTTVSDHLELLRTDDLGGRDFQNILSVKNHPEIEKLVILLISEIRNRQYGFKVSAKGITLSIMSHLHRLSGLSNHSDVYSDTVMKVSPALQCVSENYQRDIPIPNLAEICSMSETHFRRIFKSATGNSPLDYIKKLRIGIAKALLMNENITVLEISSQSGYNTLSSFNRDFRKLTGVSPSKFRQDRKLWR